MTFLLRDLVGGVLNGRYRIERLVGAGGMGAVYEATQLSLGRRVAIKVIKPRDDADEQQRKDALRRFDRETQAIARLQHPNIVAVIDAGTDDERGLTYLAMELLVGEDVRRLSRREGALPVARAAAIVEDIASALAAAHAAGIVHRDLKAENVMLVAAAGKREQAKVLDFGIARLVNNAGSGAHAASENDSGASDANRITATGVVAGTPGCMAPEQMLGKSDDPRSDLYSLGVMLFELVAGCAPFSAASSVELMMKHMSEPAPKLSSRVPPHIAVDARADELVAALLAKDPAQRPQSAVAVVEKLRTLIGRASAQSDSNAATATDLERPNLAALAAATPGSGATPRSPVATTAFKPIAVLPLKNAGAPEDAYLADGATDDLIDALSMTKGLRVRPRGVVAAKLTGAASQDPGDIGRALDVECIVEGSVRRTANGVMLTARLVGVADGFQMWAKRLQCPVGELLVATDEAARAIAEALHASVDAPKREAFTDDVAVELYLQARASLRRNWYSHGTDAIALFQRALERAHDDPLIIAGYAMAKARFARNTEELTSARALAEKATVAAPHRAEPWLALAMVLRMEQEDHRLVPLLARALHIAPDNAEAHYQLGRLMLSCGPLDKARKHLERAVSLEPADAERRAYLGLAQLIAGDMAGAEATFATNIEGQPGSSIFRSNACRLAMALKRPPSFAPEGPLEDLLIGVTRGETPSREAIEARIPRIPRRAYVGFSIEAEVHAYLGNVDDAIASLSKAFEAGGTDELWVTRGPVFAPLRADARFAALTAQLHARNAPLREALATHALAGMQ